jgi:hypothetical protein
MKIAVLARRNTMNHQPQTTSAWEIGQVKRKYRRAGMTGFVGDVADGKNIFSGYVSDISVGGFKIADLPQSFSAERHTYTAILSGGGKHYRVLAKPCWQHNSAMKSRIDIGFKIIDAPWEWVEFTMKEIPEFDYEDSLGFLS